MFVPIILILIMAFIITCIIEGAYELMLDVLCFLWFVVMIIGLVSSCHTEVKGEIKHAPVYFNSCMPCHYQSSISNS